MTKEELLRKGVSEDVADEIISAFEDNGQDNSLSLLEKALNKGSDKSESLFKAEEEEGKEHEKKESKEKEKGEEEEGDYDEKYMKKYMKRYMKENEKEFEGDLKKCFGKMNKAVSDIDMAAEGAVVEMIDLKPFLENQMSMNEEMCKAISTLQAGIKLISSQNEQSFDLMEKAARVQVEQAKALDGVLSVPQGRKGILSQTVDMEKAKNVATFGQDANTKIYTVLMKAVKAGDRTAGQVISAFESNGKNANRLNTTQRQYVSELLTKEAH